MQTIKIGSGYGYTTFYKKEYIDKSLTLLDEEIIKICNQQFIRTSVFNFDYLSKIISAGLCISKVYIEMFYIYHCVKNYYHNTSNVILYNEYLKETCDDNITEKLLEHLYSVYIMFLDKYLEKINLLSIYNGVQYKYIDNNKYIEELYIRGLSKYYIDDYDKYNVKTLKIETFNMIVKYCPELYFDHEIIRSMWCHLYVIHGYTRNIDDYKCILKLINHNIINNKNTNNTFVNNESKYIIEIVIDYITETNDKLEPFLYLCGKIYQLNYKNCKDKGLVLHFIKFLVKNTLSVDEYQY